MTDLGLLAARLSQLRTLDRLNATVFAIAKPVGCPKGVYRFKNHEEQNRFDEKILIESMTSRKQS